MTSKKTTSQLREGLLVIAAVSLVGSATTVAAVAHPSRDAPVRGGADRALQKSLDSLVSEGESPAAFA
ncbi:hypothetical protein [Streptomyces sp. cmx-18-6]|uniref:hypothetical protein n=1 Tax=Streptomyces sp. cmx-18-6 TaxID=2790930 RepID=UPI00397F1299